MKVKYFTFRTNPYKTEIPEAFIFGNLKEDFKIFSDIIKKEEPALIIGLANSKMTKIEQKTINQFNKSKTVVKSGKDIFGLYVPSFLKFKVSSKETDSFCNWTMYKICHFIDSEKLNTKLTFIHINPADLKKLLDLIPINT